MGGGGTSRTTGTYRERAINSAGAELMVLSRTADGWNIRAIHWSSRSVRTPRPAARGKPDVTVRRNAD